MNLSLIDTKIIQLINQYSINGDLTPFSNGSIKDYLLRTRNLIDSCQKELATIRKIPSVYYFTLTQTPNSLTDGDKSYHHLNEDIIFSATGSKSYYFEVYNPCVVTIEVNGIVQNVLNLSPRELTEYRGFITSNANDNVRLIFKGDYPYVFKNIALYPYQYASINDIPQYKLYNKIALPLDFMEFREISIESNSSYIPLADYKIEGRSLLINKSLAGSVALSYFKYPSTITKDTIETTELEIDLDIQELIPYYVAGHVYLEDNITIATMLLNEYEQKKNSIRNVLPSTVISIENMFEGFM